jgi:transcriptional regulator with PAS, ATPase and Fis domain
VLSGNFREDLYFRIHIIPIHLPPLRKRREDIPLLIEHFLDVYTKKHGTAPYVLSQKDMAFFLQYSYPGNVRELQNMIERVCMGYGIEEIAASQSPFDSRLFDLPDDMAGLLNSEDPLRDARAKVERDIIVKALEMHNYNHTRAAGTLKISRAALYKKIKQHALKDGQV